MSGDIKETMLRLRENAKLHALQIHKIAKTNKFPLVKYEPNNLATSGSAHIVCPTDPWQRK